MTAHTLQTLAVESVQERGFYDEKAIPALARNPQLAAQVLRLTEECGELCRAVANGAGPEKIADEAADVQIVAYQIAHLTGQRVQELRPGLGDDYLRPEALGLLGLLVAGNVGELCRAIRKNSPHAIDANLGLLWLNLARLVVAAGGGELADAVIAKLDADSTRGYLHGEPIPAAPRPGVRVAGAVGLGDPNLSDLGEEHNAYTDGPILSGAAAGLVDRPLNLHIWQNEEPVAYTADGGLL